MELKERKDKGERIMYAVGIINAGKVGCYVQCGNDGLQKLRNKTRRGWMSETEIMRKNADFVVVVNDFTQKMCEMGPGELARYCDRIAIARLK